MATCYPQQVGAAQDLQVPRLNDPGGQAQGDEQEDLGADDAVAQRLALLLLRQAPHQHGQGHGIVAGQQAFKEDEDQNDQQVAGHELVQIEKLNDGVHERSEPECIPGWARSEAEAAHSQHTQKFVLEEPGGGRDHAAHGQGEQRLEPDRQGLPAGIERGFAGITDPHHHRVVLDLLGNRDA